MPTTRSDVLRANAWCGSSAAMGTFSPKSTAWALRGAIAPPQYLAGVRAAPGLDLRHWRDLGVGWGVVLPDRPGLADPDKAMAADAPEPIRRLIAARSSAPVFRYRADVAEKGMLLRHFATRPPLQLLTSGTRGIADSAVPRYLLIVGTPEEIPWRFQYRLQTDAFVGRLDLDDAALARYVDALLDDWRGSARDVDRPLVWSVDHGYPDITYLMRKTIGEKMHAAFEDNGFHSVMLSDGLAEAARLYAALHAQHPAFVLTTSHGATFPLSDAGQLKDNLGLLVDCNHALIDTSALLKEWSPGGAIWYAHACCSAGADKPSVFADMVDAQSTLGRMLDTIATIGPCSAPMPRALLGANEPMAAFIGHVEPTFDWTLYEPDNGQRMTDALILGTLFTSLHSWPRTPVGMALDGYYDAVAGLLLDHSQAVEAVNRRVSGAMELAKKAKLLAMDRLSMVLLGDPTVCLP